MPQIDLRTKFVREMVSLKSTKGLKKEVTQWERLRETEYKH